MKVAMRSDLVSEDLLIPTMDSDRYLSPSDLRGARFISDDNNGLVELQLKTGETVNVYSIDLEFETN